MPLSNDLKLLKNSPLAFAKAYWVAPGSGYAMIHGGATPYVALNTVFQGSVPTTDSLLTLSTNTDKVAYAKLERAAGDKYDLKMFSHRQVNPAQRGDYLPVWFLPWFSDHVTKLKILQRGLLPPTVPDPDLFFTSALSGCSVFVDGPANSPTVYHGGFSSARDFALQPRVNDPITGAEASSIQHWRLLFARYAPGAANVSEVTKDQYISPGGSFAQMTPDMQVYKQFLDNEHKDQLRFQDMRGEGTVFGVRDAAGNWSFYLQESVTITMYTLIKKKKLIGKDKVITGQLQTFTRPIVVKQIFPNGANAMTWNLSRVIG